ncbi:MAG: RNA polymerase Rpb4 family protein [Nanoarchaeota archaeon]|nr:RNA polymerase Rpb4 family protein [Nanoarchaeota archaeon]
MKIIEIEPVSMPEAKSIMAKREKVGEMNYEQKLALEHLKCFTRLTPSDAKKMTEEITNIIKMSPETLVQIINILPKNADELRMIFAREKFSLQEEEVKKILEIVAKFK